MKKIAWLSGVGLYHNFTYAGISIGSETKDIDEDFLKDFLDEHPEGIVIYNYSKPHAILITDYNEDTFYCADPSNHISKGRIQISKASMGISGCTRYWYVKSPTGLSYGDKNDTPSEEPDENDSEHDIPDVEPTEESPTDSDNLPESPSEEPSEENPDTDPEDPDNNDSDLPDKELDNDSDEDSRSHDFQKNNPSGRETVKHNGFVISYNTEIPFNGKKLSLKNFGNMTVSYDGTEYNVEKIKVNRKSQTFQILALAGANKRVNKLVKKATGKSDRLDYYQKPYHITGDMLDIKYTKNGIKKINIHFIDNLYKVKKDEYTYKETDNVLIFDSKNLSGRISL